MIFWPNGNMTANSNKFGVISRQQINNQQSGLSIDRTISVRKLFRSLAILLTLVITVLSSGRHSVAQDQAGGAVRSSEQNKSPEQNKPVPGFSTLQDPASSRIQQNLDQNVRSAEIVAEINAIRSQLGGGVAGHLEGLFQNPATPQELQREFEKELMRKLDAPTAGGIGADGLPLDDLPDSNLPLARLPGTQPAKNFMRPSQGVLPRSNSTQLLTPANIPSQSASRPEIINLRKAARHLEAAAADLEEVGLFSEADQLREQAKLLWRRARGDHLG